MSKKYHPAQTFSIITNDLFLAAFLHSVGCHLDRVERNDRRRVSFVFSGERVRELRESYRCGKVSLDIKLFRGSMHLMRERMDEALALPPIRNHSPEERSIQYARTQCHDTARQSSLTAQPQF
jgi:hypothetical protein